MPADTERCPFHIGQKVTPRGTVTNPIAIAEGIKAGGVYTISGIYMYRTKKGRDVALLQFAEVTPILNDTRPPYGGWVWHSFRPVTDISALTALLNTTKTPKLEDA